MSKKVAVAKKSLTPKKPVKTLDAEDDVSMQDVQGTTPNNNNKKAPAKTTTTTGSTALTNTVVATDLPAGTSLKAISESFSKHGDVASVRFAKGSKTEAIITFSTEEEAEAAITDGSITVDGKKATVRAPKAKEETKPSVVLVVRNIPFTATLASLKKLFSPYGTIANINKAKGAKGHAGVTFSSVDEATAAFEALDGSVFEGRTLTLKDRPTPPGSITVNGKKVAVRAPKGKPLGEHSPVVVDRNIPFGKGYGGVNFSTVDEATAALEALNGSVSEGGTLTVNYAKQRWA
ncbi:hypothetical protein DFJ73DRAFT_786613 [Zopfochytrium polystomum]|nr:hypothetical protein DFJ73DRAFT_786613 [Zopfochytrium polystomum]